MQFNVNESVNRWNVCFYENDWKVVRFCWAKRERKYRANIYFSKSQQEEKLSFCNQSKNQETNICVWSNKEAKHICKAADTERERELKKVYRFSATRIFKGDMGFQIRTHNIICNTSEIKIYTALKQKHRQSVTWKIVILARLHCLSSKCVFFCTTLPLHFILLINTLGVGYSLVFNSNRYI